MRALVFLLVAANLLFMAWGRGDFGNGATRGAGRAQRQPLMAERVKIVARDEPPPAAASASKPAADASQTAEPAADAAPEAVASADAPDAQEAPDAPAKPEKPEKPIGQVCLALGDLSAEELARVTEMTNGRFRDFRAERRSFAASRSYWVFIPPLPNRQAAERQSEALKRAGAPEFFIVQEPQAMRFAISLGVFSTREAAEERMTDLRLRGVDAARVGERETRPAVYQLELRGPEPRASALRQALAGVLPKARPSACKAR